MGVCGFLVGGNLAHFDGHFLLGDEEVTGSEQTGNADHTAKIADRIIVADDDLPGNGHNEHFQRVGRGHVDEHAHKLHAYDDG